MTPIATEINRPYAIHLSRVDLARLIASLGTAATYAQGQGRIDEARERMSLAGRIERESGLLAEDRRLLACLERETHREPECPEPAYLEADGPMGDPDDRDRARIAAERRAKDFG